jgi:hypothetical protein
MRNTQIISSVFAVLACAACSSDESTAEGTQTAADAGGEVVPVVPVMEVSEVPTAKDAGSTAAAVDAAAAPAASDAGTVAQDAGKAAEPAASAGISDWAMLVDGAWELGSGEEGYRCARLTATEDLYIKEFQPIAPLGTHHTLLSVNEEPTAPDGIAVCGANDNGHVTLLGSGVGENYSSGPLPDGVAYKIPKGAQINLNLHLFNTQDGTLKGVSGVKVRTTTADKVKEFAQVTLAGSVALSIPVGESTSKGTCTLVSDATLFAVSPHMHQLGTHLKAVAKPAGSEPVTLYDGPYDFNEQRQYPADMLKLKAGDTVDVECTYENTTAQTVMFGESSLDEMCFIGLYRFPLSEDGLVCVR